MKLRKGVQHRRATFTLHRYFLWAYRMRTHFDDLLKKRIQRTAMGEKANQFYSEETMYMSYWYGGLYVVIEGWKQLMARAGLSTFYYSRGEVERGRALAAEMLAVAEARGDREQTLIAHTSLAGPEHYQGQFASSLAHCERAIAIYD